MAMWLTHGFGCYDGVASGGVGGGGIYGWVSQNVARAFDFVWSVAF
jgi:hypothetical protein